MLQAIEGLQNTWHRLGKGIGVTGLFIEVDEGVLSYTTDELLNGGLRMTSAQIQMRVLERGYLLLMLTFE